MIPAARNTTHVTGHGDVQLHVPEWGNPDGPPILLVHGWSQAHPCWARQLSGTLDQFRLVAPDLRGHGWSEKPGHAEAYDRSEIWASDIAAVIADLRLEGAVLVGWSMGGWVVQDYLRHHGDADIAGFALVGTSVNTGSFVPPAAREKRLSDAGIVAAGMNDDTNLAENLAATRTFVRACFHQQPEADALAEMVGFNMLCPVQARRASRSRSEDYRPDHANLTVPALIQWGQHERLALPQMIEETRQTIPRAKSIAYANSGHAPFWEEADTFNKDLSAFVLSCQESGA